MNKLIIIIVLGMIFSTCSNNSTNSEETIPFEFAENVILLSDFNTDYKELNIRCNLDQLFHLENQQPYLDTLYATMGGGAGRTVLKESEDGVSLNADTHDSVKIYRSNDWDIEIKSRRYHFDEVNQFFEELTHLKGNKTGENEWEGTWSCHPLHTRGDSVGVIEGDWKIAPRD